MGNFWPIYQVFLSANVTQWVSLHAISNYYLYLFSYLLKVCFLNFGLLFFICYNCKVTGDLFSQKLSVCTQWTWLIGSWDKSSKRKLGWRFGVKNELSPNNMLHCHDNSLKEVSFTIVALLARLLQPLDVHPPKIYWFFPNRSKIPNRARASLNNRVTQLVMVCEAVRINM